jgi:uncharacterized protein
VCSGHSCPLLLTLVLIVSLDVAIVHAFEVLLLALLPGRSRAVVEVKSERKVEGSGQKCPLHTRTLYNEQKSMDIRLTETEVRVLGSLIEKDITTPEYYPLSLNALLNACNQKSNRDPVMQLDEDAVRDALDGLQQQRMAGPARGADSRVTKYEQRLQEVFNFTRPEIAVLCVLLLRGPQTPGELRGRAERLHRFEALEDVQSALQKLMQREPPLAKVLPRQPGTKESRYAHLLAGDVVEAEVPVHVGAGSEHNSAGAERIARLEAEVAELRREVSDVKDQLAKFQKQFE